MGGLRRLRRHGGWLAIAAVLGALVALWLGTRAAPTYSATAQVFVAVDPASPGGHGADADDVVQERADAYAGAATSPAVLTAVVTKLNLPESWTALSGQVDAEHADGTLTIDVTAQAATGAKARNIADAVAEQLCLAARQLEPATTGGRDLVKLTVTRPAVAPTTPDGLPALPTGLAGGAAGLAAGLVLVAGRDRLDRTVRGRRDAARAGTAPVLGEVPLVPALGGPDGDGAVDAAAADLAAALGGLPVVLPLQSLVVTSADAGDGKSSVAAHLAHALAATGRRVVLVDADLRKPRQHEVWGTPISPGLTDVLAGSVDAADCLVPAQEQDTPAGAADPALLLPAGAASARSTDLVGTHAMSELLRTLEAQGYLVVVDAPPLLPVVDGSILARMTEGALLVTRAHRTRRDHLAGAAELLRTSGAGLLGVVVNGTLPGDGVRGAVGAAGVGPRRARTPYGLGRGTRVADRGRLRPTVTRLRREGAPTGR